LKGIKQTFLRGVAVLLPLAITVSILYWIGVTLESLLGGLMRLLLPDELYRPGLGLGVALLIILAAGILVRAWIVGKVVEIGERLIAQVPLARSIYGAVRDFTRFLSVASERDHMDQVVLVRIADDIHLVGFVTEGDPGFLGVEWEGDVPVPVWVPMSYQIGGYTVLVPRSRLTRLDLSMEDAMRWVLTAGVSRAN
jgi:uncharacterized membrane protein